MDPQILELMRENEQLRREIDLMRPYSPFGRTWKCPCGVANGRNSYKCMLCPLHKDIAKTLPGYEEYISRMGSQPLQRYVRYRINTFGVMEYIGDTVGDV